MDETGISWADATFNPWIGCAKVSPGCAHCYAETLAENRMGLTEAKGTAVWGATAARRVTADSNWKKPVRWNRLAMEGKLPNRAANQDGHRPRVFCASMADVFEPRTDLEAPRRRLFDLIEQTPALDWMLLTKRPEIARAWLFDFYMRRGTRDWVSRDHLGWGVLPNVWIGASVENARFTWRADMLRDIPAAVRFISAEPLLGSLYEGRPPRLGVSTPPDARSLQSSGVGVSGSSPDLSIATTAAAPFPEVDQPAGQAQAASGGRTPTRERAALDLTGIDWIIVGGESGGRTHVRPMHPRWALEILGAVFEHRADVAFHFKQHGSWEPVAAVRHGEDSGRYLWLTPSGDRLPLYAIDGADVENGTRLMRYAGAAPGSGGNLLARQRWQEFPVRAEAAATA